MHHKSTKKISFQQTKIEKNFTSGSLTSYSGLIVFNDYLEKIGLYSLINKNFTTIKQNATKVLNSQTLISIMLANLCGISRLSNIENFSNDPLIRKILGLKQKLDDSTIKTILSKMGQIGANNFLEMSFEFIRKDIEKHCSSVITLDCDSTEKTVYGHQAGAEKGYNPKNKGKKSYHPLLCFVSDMKIVVNSWFRPGNTYTSNGIMEFMKQTLAVLPTKIKKIFFRADSGFFNGELFDLLELEGHDYLVKAKLTNQIKSKLGEQNWQQIDKDAAICSFEYQAFGWEKSRRMYCVRILKKYEKKEYFGSFELVPIYDYFCYCTNLKGLTAKQIHALYGQRAETENWIEHTKNQLCAGQTITNDFHVNDILWQLSVMAYNISVLMRYESDHKIWRQEPKTFRDWFICVPGKVVTNARKTTVKMSKNYIYRKKWEQLTEKIATAA